MLILKPKACWTSRSHDRSLIWKFLIIIVSFGLCKFIKKANCDVTPQHLWTKQIVEVAMVQKTPLYWFLLAILLNDEEINMYQISCLVSGNHLLLFDYFVRYVKSNHVHYLHHDEFQHCCSESKVSMHIHFLVGKYCLD